MSKRKSKSDSLLTLGYLGVTVALLAIAFFTYPWISPPKPRQEVNKPLFDWETLSADNVGSLEIIRYEPVADKLVEFRVEKNRKGIWTIPSSEGYPADAEEQMRTAITSFSGTTVIDVIQDKEDLFKDYGVLEPDRTKIDTGQEGVGVLVTLKDRNGDLLGSVIIGKSASVVDEESAESSSQSLRFVRKPGQPLVYVINYDPSVLKTDFRDWIDKDVLQLKVIDIASVNFNDYQVVEANPPLRQRFNATVASEGTRWNLTQFMEFDDPKNPTERTIGPNEQLNNVSLNKMAETLSSLEIVDVARKPAGIKADLTAVEGESDLLSLKARGFVPISRQRGLTEIFSMNGEMTVDTKDGVRYLLRFGKNRPSEDGLDGTLDRYMMVSASVNEDLFPMPEKPVISAPAEGGEGGAPQPPEGGAPKPPENDKDGQPGNDSTDDEGGPDEGMDDACVEPLVQEDDDEERRRLETEYRRKVQLRKERLEAAQDRVDALNQRFGEWYFVISEESFKALRLGRDELIVDKSGPQSSSPGTSGVGPLRPGVQ